MLRDILLLFALTAATLSQVGKISQIGKLPTSPSFRQSLSNPDMPSSPADPEVPSSLSSSTFSESTASSESTISSDSTISSASTTSSASTVSSASPTSSTRRGKGDPDAWKTGYPERDWHKTCLPCYGNAALVDGNLLQLGCSDNNSTDYDEFTSFSELDLDLCLTNNDGVINNFDNNTLKPITGHQRHPNGNFSRNCNCYLQWGFLNGSLMCRCGMESVKNQALNSIWVFEDALANDEGNVSCKLGEEKMYSRKMESCPKLPALQKQPGH